MRLWDTGVAIETDRVDMGRLFAFAVTYFSQRVLRLLTTKYLDWRFAIVDDDVWGPMGLPGLGPKVTLARLLATEKKRLFFIANGMNQLDALLADEGCFCTEASVIETIELA